MGTMKTATVIVDDGTVIIDGVAVSGLDMSSVSADIHAVQWDGVTATGEIEYRTVRCAHCGVSSRKPNLSITDFSPFSALADAHQKAVSVAASETQKEV